MKKIISLFAVVVLVITLIYAQATNKMDVDIC